MAKYSKHQPVIEYVVNGTVISTSKLNLGIEVVTQAAVNIAAPLIAQIHCIKEPYTLQVRVRVGKEYLPDRRFTYNSEEPAL